MFSKDYHWKQKQALGEKQVHNKNLDRPLFGTRKRQKNCPLDASYVKGTWTPLLARNCLKSAIFISPTNTVLCDGAGDERGSKDNMPLSVFPTSASIHANS